MMSTPAVEVAVTSINPLPTCSEEAPKQPVEPPRASSGLDEEQFQKLVKVAREFGSKYGRPYVKTEVSFTKAFKEHLDDFICLRGMFPPQGSHGTRLVAGKEYTWADFCKEFLGITSDYFGRLVRKLRPGPNRKRRPINKNNPNYRAGYRAGLAAAESSLEAANKSATEKLEPTPEEANKVASEEAPDEAEGASLTDVQAYFAQHKQDAAAFAEELRAVVRHFGLARKISVDLLS